MTPEDFSSQSKLIVPQLYSKVDLCGEKVRELGGLLEDLRTLIDLSLAASGPANPVVDTNTDVCSNGFVSCGDTQDHIEYIRKLEADLLASRRDVDLLFSQMHELSLLVRHESSEPIEQVVGRSSVSKSFLDRSRGLLACILSKIRRSIAHRARA